MSQSEERVQMEPEWKARLLPEFSAPYMLQLREFLHSEKQRGRRIYPPGGEIFNAFNSTPFSAVRVIIIGQDPYHGPGQAHGLCFSVREGVPPPPSLQNIFRELASDIGMQKPQHGCLQNWTAQGVLLLNSVLTVEQGRAASHQGRGWERFTDRAIELLNEERDGLVFMLWGSYAQKKGQVIDARRHLVLKSPHPSPLAASRGFFGCRHFSRANAYLQSRGERPIDWAALMPDRQPEPADA